MPCQGPYRFDPRLLLGACAAGFPQGGTELARTREGDVRLGRRYRCTLPPQSGPSRGVGRDGAVLATTCCLGRAPPRPGDPTAPDASPLRGASPRARPPPG